MKTSTVISITLFLIFSMVLGCANDSGVSVPYPAPGIATMPALTAIVASETTVPERWHIHFTFSGGIAGLRRIVELADTGQLTVKDEKTNRWGTMQLSATELAEIATLVAKTKSITSSGHLPLCRDCFEYSLDIRLNGQLFSFRANDLSLAESGLESLIQTLVRLQDKALSK